MEIMPHIVLDNCFKDLNGKVTQHFDYRHFFCPGLFFLGGSARNFVDIKTEITREFDNYNYKDIKIGSLLALLQIGWTLVYVGWTKVACLARWWAWRMSLRSILVILRIASMVAYWHSYRSSICITAFTVSKNICNNVIMM